MYLGDTFAKWTPAKPCRQIPPIQKLHYFRKKSEYDFLDREEEAITLNDSIPRSRPGYYLGYTERTRSGDPCLHN